MTGSCTSTRTFCRRWRASMSSSALDSSRITSMRVSSSRRLRSNRSRSSSEKSLLGSEASGRRPRLPRFDRRAVPDHVVDAQESSAGSSNGSAGDVVTWQGCPNGAVLQTDGACGTACNLKRRAGGRHGGSRWSVRAEPHVHDRPCNAGDRSEVPALGSTPRDLRRTSEQPAQEAALRAIDAPEPFLPYSDAR